MALVCQPASLCLLELDFPATGLRQSLRRATEDYLDSRFEFLRPNDFQYTTVLEVEMRSRKFHL